MVKDTIGFEDFVTLDLRVGTIKKAEAVEGSDRLVKMHVDLGSEVGTRQIIAGIRTWYEPDILIDKQIVVLVNLAPRKMMGMDSEGMMLAAGDKEAILLHPDKKLPPGTIVR